MSGGRGLGLPELLLGDPELLAEADVKRHLGVQGLVEEPREPAHILDASGLGDRERDRPAEFDQKEVVLPHVEAEFLEREGPVADARDERVALLLLPYVRSFLAKLGGKTHGS